MGINGLHKFKKKFWRPKLFQHIVCPEGILDISLVCGPVYNGVLLVVHVRWGGIYRRILLAT